MKALGAEIIAFYKAWPVGSDFYHEESIITEDGDGSVTSIDPVEEYDVYEALGYFVWQGKGDMPPFIKVNGIQIRCPEEGPPTDTVFKAWRGDKRPFTVVLSPEEGEKFKAVCAEHGWEIA